MRSHGRATSWVAAALLLTIAACGGGQVELPDGGTGGGAGSVGLGGFSGSGATGGGATGTGGAAGMGGGVAGAGGTAGGAGFDAGDVDAGEELEIEPPEPDAGAEEPPQVDAGHDAGVPPADAGHDAGVLPADAGRPDAGLGSCVHSLGGLYVSGGCSAGYQCINGTWRLRTSTSVCLCVEPTGTIGCSGPSISTDAGAIMPPASTSSESIGTPGSGRLERSMRLTPTNSFVVFNNGRGAQYGTEETVFWLRTGFDRTKQRHPAAPLPQVHDMSIIDGGRPATGAWPHASHLSGRDVDGTYYRTSCAATGCPLSTVSPTQLDAVATWSLFETWIRAGVAMYIFVDHSLQQPLYDEAQRRGATPAQLAAWFQYPRPIAERVGIIRHVDNHANHFHVRFVCPADDPRCIP